MNISRQQDRQADDAHWPTSLCNALVHTILIIITLDAAPATPTTSKLLLQRCQKPPRQVQYPGVPQAKLVYNGTPRQQKGTVQVLRTDSWSKVEPFYYCNRGPQTTVPQAAAATATAAADGLRPPRMGLQLCRHFHTPMPLSAAAAAVATAPVAPQAAPIKAPAVGR
jgi:hypothetical protein